MQYIIVALIGIIFIIGMILYKSALTELQDIAEQYDDILEAYTKQYNDFLDEQDKLCDLLNQYHTLLDGYQIPLIQIPNARQKEQYLNNNDDW